MSKEQAFNKHLTKKYVNKGATQGGENKISFCLEPSFPFCGEKDHKNKKSFV